jgi:hypothetical protein
MIPVGILTAAATSSFSFLLDDYPNAAAAYSLRKLRSAYTGSCIRVTRTSDLVQQDIGFVNNVLDLTTLQTFIGSSSGAVNTWYDQSGNSRNATLIGTITSNVIISSGTLQTINSLPAINLPNLNIPNFTLNSDLSYFLVQRKIASNAPGINIGSNLVLGILFSNWSDSNLYFQRSNGTTGFIVGSPDATTGNQLLNAFNQSGTMSMYKNNAIYTLSLNTTFSITNSNMQKIGQANGLASTGLGTEIIIYANSQLANRTGINTNINSFYTIY